MMYHAQTVPELISQSHDVEWWIEGVLPKDGVLLLTGEPGIGKTWLVLDMSLSLDGGREWLGRFATKKAKVLVVDEENNPSLLKHRFQKLDGAQSGILLLVGVGVMLDDDQRYDALEDLLERESPDVVVLDSLIRFHGGDENLSSEMSKVNARIDRLRRKHHCAFVICHHRKKPGMGHNDPANAFRGSSEIKAFPDTHMDLHGTSDGKIITSMPKCRHQEAIEPFEMEVVDVDETRTVVRYAGPVVSKSKQRVGECLDLVKDILSDGTLKYRTELVSLAKSQGFSRDQVDDALKALPHAEYRKDKDNGKDRYQMLPSGA